VTDEDGVFARVEPRLPLPPLLEQLQAKRPELAMQLPDEVQPRIGRYAENCASSVEPLSASVDESGDTACATRSK
jgi:hypothetical protein